ENFESVEWRFGDDSVSKEASPTHIYATAGKFEINMKVTSKDGSTARKLLSLAIEADSIADFRAIPTGAENTVKLTYEVKDPRIKVKSVKWNLPNGETSTEENPVKTYEPNKFFDASVDI